ncbi:ABC transporter substrate-binding protein [Actinoalloteichus hymeniacidonis]|uniref:ABC-type dipeptide transport system, periplasmic component n=1 Tax=Actinoalloteichus hymeniacidonis TaxID=340345 RepID=A0AAC9HRT9_9PSEU|nr:ABC transporter substrate-binding protein [Actinoalloteichus hymeniacidonis]AOS64208.1 ABC-type dipeptide transport system, periplasmic component [Actinoalloteichus hymeniacidonis]MBB5907724.1 peptide/nickel transport system substrate-binding protein [Actinoalloteichus hymeniacidonis]
MTHPNSASGTRRVRGALRVRTRVRGALAIGAVALVTVAAGACSPVQPPPPVGDRQDVTGTPIGDTPVQEGGDLVMGLSSEPDELDPTTSTSLYTRYVMSSVCEKLYDIDAEGELVPQLATELPTTSDDGLSVTIPLRNGVSFADGAEFDAEAVRTTLLRHLEKEDSSRRTELGPIESIEVLDPEHVVLHYSEPFAPITAALADRAGMILSPVAIEELGDDFGSQPVCVGPFKFVDRVPQTSISVERDPLYYDADQVHLDTVTYRIMNDPSIRAANLRSGDVQVADTISPTEVDALDRESGIEVLQTGSLGYQGVTFNVGNVDGVGAEAGEIDTPLASDPRVRQAFSHAVDREALVNSVFNNWFDPACSPISPDSPFSSESSEACPEYNPELSRQLLAEAGVETPYRIKISAANNADTLRFSQALQASVLEGGFELEIVPVEYSTLLDVQAQGTFDAVQLGWSGRIDPNNNIRNFYETGAGSNYAGYNSAEVDDLLAAATATDDVAERTELYGEIVRIIHRDNPVVYLYRQRNLTAHRSELGGVEVYADGVVRLGRAGFLIEEG